MRRKKQREKAGLPRRMEGSQKGRTEKAVPVQYLRIGMLSFVLLLLFAALPVRVFAANKQKAVDMAGLLDTEEEARLQEQFSGIAEAHSCDVAVVTTDSCGGKSPQEYTDSYYYANGYGYGSELDGIMLMVSMKERKFHLATRGKAIRIFTDYGLERMDELITPKLSDGAYYDAFAQFGELAEEFIQEYEKGTPYDRNHPYKTRLPLWARIVIAALAGLVAAVGVLVLLLAQLKSVGTKRKAKEYVRQGSFAVTRSRDVYLYRTLTRVAKPKQSSGGGGSTTHSAPGGGSAGGRTGSF